MNITFEKRYCLQCENEFVFPNFFEEYRGEYFGAPCYECFEICPFCGSMSITSPNRINRFAKQETTDDYY